MSLIPDPLEAANISLSNKQIEPSLDENNKKKKKKQWFMLVAIMVVGVAALLFFVGILVRNFARNKKTSSTGEEATTTTTTSSGLRVGDSQVSVVVGENAVWPDKARIILEISAEAPSSGKTKVEMEAKLSIMKQLLAKYGAHPGCLVADPKVVIDKSKKLRKATQQVTLSLQFPNDGQILPELLQSISSVPGTRLLSIDQTTSESQKTKMIQEAEKKAIDSITQKVAAATSPGKDKKRVAVQVLEPPVVASDWVPYSDNPPLKLFKVQVPLVVKVTN